MISFLVKHGSDVIANTIKVLLVVVIIKKTLDRHWAFIEQSPNPNTSGLKKSRNVESRVDAPDEE